jgi:Transcription factor WhiB
MTTNLWFPPRDKELYKTIAEKSKAVCYGRDGLPECPVRKECLLYADAMDDTHGIWGGMSHRERNALKRKAAKKKLTLAQWIELHGV